MPAKKRDLPRPYYNGTWTEPKFNSFIKGLLRQGHLRWNPKFHCINQCYVRDGLNPATGKKCKLHKCPECGELFPKGMMKADHIEPVIPITGFTSWDDCIKRMFLEKEGYAALCKGCHDILTKKENEERKAYQ